MVDLGLIMVVVKFARPNFSSFEKENTLIKLFYAY
jgi:hypothetical protein